MYKKQFIFAILILAFSFSAYAQKDHRGLNLPSFDYRKYHFGFLLSYNNSDFSMEFKPDYTFNDSLLGIENLPQPGFNLALLASLDITKNVHVRFLPGLSFQDRALKYRFLAENGRVSESIQRIESVYLDFPLVIKLRTNRVGNVAAYALIGAKYSRDMQSQKDVNLEVEEDDIIKLKDVDYSLDVGGGIDFFLTYFKFGIELKSAIGFPNVIIQENTRFSDPLESLKTRTFILSFTFEG